MSKLQTKKQLKQIVGAMGGWSGKALTKNDMMPVGKYKQYTVKEVLYSDPAYIIWMHNTTVHVVKENILQEAHKELGGRPSAWSQRYSLTSTHYEEFDWFPDEEHGYF